MGLANDVGESLKIVCKPESDVGGGLNDRLHDLSDVFMLVGEQMIAQDGLLELVKREFVGNESLARVEIDGDAVNLEARQLMKAQMRNGRDDGNGAIHIVSYGEVLNPPASLLQ